MKTAAPPFRDVTPEASNKRLKTNDHEGCSSSSSSQSSTSISTSSSSLPMNQQMQKQPSLSSSSASNNDSSSTSRYDDERPEHTDDNTSRVSEDDVFSPSPAAALHGSNVLTLDIGGERIVKTLRSTLTCARKSRLAQMFSGRWESVQPKNKDGHFFIDYKPSIFLPLLDFLRSHSSNSKQQQQYESQQPPMTPSFASPTDEASFRSMVDAFHLNNLLYNYEVYQLKPDRPFFGADRATLVSKQSSVLDYVMNSEKGVAFVLDRPVSTSGDCHARRVQAFEVTFLMDSGIKIGWTRRDIYRTQPINGMGKSISIDSRLALPGMHHFSNTSVIRCSKDIYTGVLTWYVNGKELVSTSHNLKDGANKIDDVVYVASGIASDSELIPLVVPAKGSACRFSAIELEP
ncbi:hypothetical protein MPSEU_000423400 [Mayamaea pseudoterrestris]|nr:hypothetical protein MPSEU_000423400 [Mayamaea pseudoterrestris]